MMDFESRESACIDAIKGLPLENYVLIGGYAVSSFDFPRFSVDLDIVIEEANEKMFVELLQREGFGPVEIKAKPPKDIYGGKFRRVEKKQPKASVDLLINSVISRQTGVSYSFEYLFRNSEIGEVAGFSTLSKIKARVATREMLIALKINSMRLADKRDIATLCNKEVDADKIAKHLERCPTEATMKNIDDFLETLDDARHKDSLKGVFGLSDNAYEKIIERAKRMAEELKERLKNSKE